MSTKPSTLSKPIHWVLDWDGTITKKDTLDALVSIAASSKPDFPTHERWKVAVEAYIADYTTKIAQLTPNGTLPKTLVAESALLKALKPIEQASIDRVSELQIFTGLTSSIIHSGALKALSLGEIQLRPGIPTFLNRYHENTSILSVNWSRTFISSCLSSTAASPTSQPSHPPQIYANELDNIDDNSPSSGKISPGAAMKIISSDDKLIYLNAHIRVTYPKQTIIYVGDSWTDVECLLDADLGICIRDEPMGSGQRKLAKALDRLGVEVPHISKSGAYEGNMVVWARDFDEVLDWVERNREV